MVLLRVVPGKPKEVWKNVPQHAKTAPTVTPTLNIRETNGTHYEPGSAKNNFSVRSFISDERQRGSRNFAYPLDRPIKAVMHVYDLC